MAASYLAAPRLTKEEEERERASLTAEEKISALSDLYGDIEIPDDDLSALGVSLRGRRSPSSSDATAVEETDESAVAKSLDEMDGVLGEALAEADAGDGDHCMVGAAGVHGEHVVDVSTVAYRRATVSCPDVVESKEHRLMFLRYERFDAKIAVARMLRYWTVRLSVFGDTHAFGPLTLDSGAYEGDTTELSMGYPRLSPERDASGRAIIVFDQSCIERDKYERRRMVRACWCVVHAALQDEVVQKRGFVLVGLGYGRLDQLDRKLDTLLWRTIRDVLPSRIVASHFIYGTNKHTYSLIAPNIKFFFGRLARARLREYTGSEARALEDLKRYGIEPSSMPSQIGGGWVYDDRWFEQQPKT